MDEVDITLTEDSLRRGILNKVTALTGEEGTPGRRLAFFWPTCERGTTPGGGPYGELIDRTSPGAKRTTRLSTEIDTPLMPAARMVP